MWGETAHPVRTDRRYKLIRNDALWEGTGGTHMVDTIMVGITRSGMISKTTRTSNQAVGLHKERGRRVHRRARTNIKAVETRTYNTHLSVHARIVGVSPAHYGARLKTRALSENPIQSDHQSQPIVRFERRGFGDARGRKGLRRVIGTLRYCRLSGSTAHRQTRLVARISRYAQGRMSCP
jgi:hypothetical protein